MIFSKGVRCGHVKILVVGGYPLANNPPYGGIERVVVTLVDAISKIDDTFEIEVLSRSDNVKEDFQIKKGEVNIHHFAKRRPKIISSLVRDLPTLKKRIKEINPDIVHAQGSDGAFAALKAGYPTVMTLHGIVWKEVKFYKGLYDFGRRIIYPNLTKYVLRRLQHLILISPYVEEEVKNLTKANKYLIENPISSRFFKIKNEEKNKKILYVGVVNSRKDVLALINAMVLIRREIPKTELRVVGKVMDQRYYRLIKDFVADNNLANCVHFLGQLEDKEIEKEYAMCSLLCLPSQQETAPMVIAEAMAASKPVVATNICGIPYMVIEGETGLLFEKGDVQDLAKKIIALLRNDKLRHKMGKRAKEIARQRWMDDIIGRKTIEIYQKIWEQTKCV